MQDWSDDGYDCRAARDRAQRFIAGAASGGGLLGEGLLVVSYILLGDSIVTAIAKAAVAIQSLPRPATAADPDQPTFECPWCKFATNSIAESALCPNDGHELIELKDWKARAMTAAEQLLALAPTTAWRPMASAPRAIEREKWTDVLLKFKSEIKGDSEDGPGATLKLWRGKQMVGHWTPFGWNFAAPTGYGGFAEDDFEGWKPLPGEVA